MPENKIIGLGPDGTYTSEAMKKARKMIYGGDAELQYTLANTVTLSELLRASRNLPNCVIDKRILGVLPIYNTLSGNVVIENHENIGYVQQVLDDLRNMPGSYTVGQIDIIVAQTLGYSGQVDELSTVMSNSNALNQSKRALDKLNQQRLDEGLPVLEIKECGSTAESLKIASEDRTVAGIGSLNTVLSLGLNTLRKADGSVNHLTNATTTYMNLIHPAGAELNIEAAKNQTVDIGSKNTLMIQAMIPNYKGSERELLEVLHCQDLGYRMQSVRSNGLKPMDKLMDVNDAKGKIPELLRNLQYWETKTDGKIIVKGIYNSSNWN